MVMCVSVLDLEPAITRCSMCRLMGVDGSEGKLEAVP